MGDLDRTTTQLLLLLLTGAIFHGLWLTALLFSRRNRPARGSLLLATALFCISFYLLGYWLFLSGFIRQVPQLFGVSYPFLYLVGPFFFFFLRFSLHPDFKIRPKHAWHLLPFAVILLRYFPFMQRSTAEKKAIIDKIFHNEIIYTWGDMVLNNSAFFFTMVYAFAAYLEARQTENFQREHTNRQNARWLKYFSLIFLCLLLTDTAIKLGFYAFSLDAVTLEFLLVTLFAVALHVLGYYALSTSRGIPRVKSISSEKKYRHSPLGPEQLAHYAGRLVDIMLKEQPYLNPGLKLAELAALLNIPSAYLSQVLNDQMNTTFYDFVNKYRVEAVMGKLQKKEYEHYSLLGIGLDSGFANKTTFNRTFKKFTGLTPSEFLSKQ